MRPTDYQICPDCGLIKANCTCDERDGPVEGGSGVREPRRPRPIPPEIAAELEIPTEVLNDIWDDGLDAETVAPR